MSKLWDELFNTRRAIFSVICAGTSGAGIVGAALASGILIALLIIGVGRISGGHFDPAVTLAIYICRDIRLLVAIYFVLAQTLGGILGAYLGKISVGDAFYFGNGVAGANGLNVPAHIQYGYFEGNPVLNSNGNLSWTVYSPDGPVGILEVKENCKNSEFP